MKKHFVLAGMMAAAASLAHADDLTIEQKVIGAQMNQLVVHRGIASRLSDLCANVVLDEKAMVAQRRKISQAARHHFSTEQAFLEAAGINEQEKTGEAMRRFFFDRGVVWDSPSAEYCTLARSLKDVGSPVAAYFEVR